MLFLHMRARADKHLQLAAADGAYATAGAGAATTTAFAATAAIKPPHLLLLLYHQVSLAADPELEAAVFLPGAVV